MKHNKLNIKDLDLQKSSKINANNFPLSSGVYLFFDVNKNILYVGKAKNLRNRIRSYFQTKLYGKTKAMINKAKYFTYIKVSSEIESLLLEAKLIRSEKPQYNLELKDDKHPLYIKITNEKYPRVLTARKIDNEKDNLATYGPFPSSGNVNRVLKMIRRIFPFSTHKTGKRACVHSQIGLCSPCPNVIESKTSSEKKLLIHEYKSNIRYIKRFLDGNFKDIKDRLLKEIDRYSSKEDYEKAKALKDKLGMVEYITQPITNSEEYIKNPNLLADIRKKELLALQIIITEYFNGISKLDRVECFDVSHIQGSLPTASMVTFWKGNPDKNYYRRFKVRQSKKQSDTDSLKEVAKRRKNHLNDWGKPDLMIIDGGKGQVSAFFSEITDLIPIVGIAKRDEVLIIPIIRNGKILKYHKKRLRGDALHLVQRLRDEAHRFSRVYHHKLVEKKLFDSVN